MKKNLDHNPRTVCELDATDLEQVAGGLYADGTVKAVVTMIRLLGSVVA